MATFDAQMDRDIFQQTKDMRDHEQAMARISADESVKLAQIRQRRMETRLAWLGYVGVGTAIVTVIAIIIGAIVWNVREDKAMQDRERDRQAEVARTCIQEGNIWHDGSCLITRRD